MKEIDQTSEFKHLNFSKSQSNIHLEPQNSMQNGFQKNSAQNFSDTNLIQLHKIFGNKWKKISTHFADKDDSSIKNHFYSLLRRSLRKINSFIRGRKKLDPSKSKILKLNFVFKLTNLAESQRNSSTNQEYYTNLLYQFLQLRHQTFVPKKNNLNNLRKQFFLEEVQIQKVERLISCLKEIQVLFLEHNLNKKGKSKKKCPKKLQSKRNIIQKSFWKEDQNMPDRMSDYYTISDEIQQQSKEIGTISCQLLSYDFQQDCRQFQASIFATKLSFDPILFQ